MSEIQTLSQQDEIDEAGKPHQFKGQKLEPFSFGRVTAWRRMGGDSVEDTLEAAVLIVWLCTQGAETVDAFRGATISTARISAMTWADKNVGKTKKKKDELLELANRIYREFYASDFEIDDDKPGTADPNA